MCARIVPERPYNCNRVKSRWSEAPPLIMIGLLAALVATPFVLPRAPHTDDGHAPQTHVAGHKSTGASGGSSGADSRKGTHDHDLAAGAPHWYLTVHGGGDLADVFALDETGRVIGGVLGPVNDGEGALQELRGICLTGDGRLAVVNAYLKASRVLVFGAPGSNDVRPYQRTWVEENAANPGMVHPYQIAIAPDGTLYASNQDTNTVTRYAGLGSAQPGQPLPIPAGLAQFGTLAPGTMVPNSQHSPEGLHEVRGIAFGPDGLLYVADRGAQEVLAFDTTTGRRARIVLDKTSGLGHPIQLLFTPDRTALLVSDNLHDCVWRVDLATGRATQLVKPKAGGLNAASALAIEGEHLYVGSRAGQSVLRYQLSNGAFSGVFARLKGDPEFFISTQQK